MKYFFGTSQILIAYFFIILKDTSSSENIGDTVDKKEISNEDQNEQLIIPTKLDSGLVEKKPQQMKMEHLAVTANLERKPGVKLKRSLTKEIQIPRSSYNANSQDLGPYEHPRDAMQKILLQFSSNEWEIIIQALQGVIRLSKHHSKLLSTGLQPYAIAVSKEIKNLRSQVARAACSCAENIFRNVKNIVDQNIEELSNALFLRCTDTNKFLREDSNKALDAMIDNVKFSKSLSILTHKGANHVNALVRASTARLLLRLLKLLGASRILALRKEKRELIFSTVIKLSYDGNMETRSHAKNIILLFADNGRLFNSFCETLPRTAIVSINKFLSAAKKK
ncbi:hypothetical protein V9T40_011937 [Parthenolecanium corni]|uniref:TOG domain-containing protein n=1 Tax=Parthenolecanium corni TaxID=536013 RepID=A0AAN9T7Z0_9HEMI